MTDLSPIQEVRVLLDSSLKIQPLEESLIRIMQSEIRLANQRMQSRLADSDFPHPSLIDPDDYAGSLIRSKNQHLLALLHHLKDCLNRGSAEFGISNHSDTRALLCTLACLTIICLPLFCYKLCKFEEKVEAERAERRQILLNQFQIMFSLFEKERSSN